jgi:predicted nucleic acid-binding protein
LIVLDASALTDFLLGRAPALEAVEGIMRNRPHQPLHAPELVEPEVLNALRRLVRSRAVEAKRAHEAVADLASLRLIRYPHAPLRERVWELRDRLSAYDATYLALAEAFADPVLLTADAALANVARRSLGAAAVQLVAP